MWTREIVWVWAGSHAWNDRQARSCWRCEEGRKAASKVSIMQSEKRERRTWRKNAGRSSVRRDRTSARPSPRPSSGMGWSRDGDGTPSAGREEETKARVGTKGLWRLEECGRTRSSEEAEGSWRKEGRGTRTRRRPSLYFDSPLPPQLDGERPTPTWGGDGSQETPSGPLAEDRPSYAPSRTPDVEGSTPCSTEFDGLAHPPRRWGTWVFGEPGTTGSGIGTLPTGPRGPDAESETECGTTPRCSGPSRCLWRRGARGLAGGRRTPHGPQLEDIDVEKTFGRVPQAGPD